jgi:choline dehydrogenase
VAGYDIVVVGGGTAGCVLAARLSDDASRRVCLLEAGPDYGPYADGRWPADLLDARYLAFSHAWETDRDDRSQLRARVLGGCSAHNACVALRGSPSDYDEWGPGWTNAELEPYLERAERTLCVRQLEISELTPLHAAFAEAAGDDTIVHPVNEVGGVRWNAAFAYLDPARGRPNLTILGEHLVDRVEHAGGRATAVQTDRGEIRAAAIVLAGGAYGTPAVLLRSGIGPESGLPVGENLVDHVGVGLGWSATERLQRETAEFATRGGRVSMGQVTIRGRSSACSKDAWDTFFFPAVEESADGYEISGAAFAMKPRSRGRVRLNGPDPRAPLAIEHGFLSEPADADVVAEGIGRLRELARADAVRPFVECETRPGPNVPALEHVRAGARGFFHPVGTCALGAVAEPDGRVRGFENLFVGDASFLPTIPRVNTNLTVAAVAERLAETITR